MSSEETMSRLLVRLWRRIRRRRRIQIGGVAVLMLITSVAETMSIGTVVPLLDIFVDPSRFYFHPRAKPVVEFLGVDSPAGLLGPVTLVFVAAALLAGALRLLLLWANSRLAFGIGIDLCVDVYRRLLYQPYAFHVARNSSSHISAIQKTSRLIFEVITPLLNLVSSAAIFALILCLLIAVNPQMILSGIAGFTLVYFAVMALTRSRLRENGERSARAQTESLRAMQEGLGGIRDILIEGTQEIHCEMYRSADHDVKVTNASTTFILSFPRVGVETLGIILIAALAYRQSGHDGGIRGGIAALGALAFGAQRALPLMQMMYSSWSGVRSSRAILRDSLSALELPLPPWAGTPVPLPVPFTRDIRFRGVSFRYHPDSRWVLRDVDCCIPRGARIGVIGETGSGKSTFLDVLMGLLDPTDGRLEIDGTPLVAGPRAWQAHISHVPQAIHLSDTSIAQNIAFGVRPRDIDHDRVRLAARQARIAEMIEALPDGFQTRVGERGVRLSGGERQRLGIARALYRKADVIVLDEATSALDNSTERSVMESFASLDRDTTVLIVAHRLTTLRSCDRIIELAGGRIVREGTYADVIGSRPEVNA